jgi:PhnB protein
MENTNAFAFAPHLNIPSGIFDISFYTSAFGAEEKRRWTNDDGSVHVAEFSLGGMLFHLHEAMPGKAGFTPARYNGTTCSIGLFVPDVHAFFDRAVTAGARILSPVTDYEYGYRQGELLDIFGHPWLIEQKI